MCDIFSSTKNAVNTKQQRGWNFPSNNNGEIRGLQDAGTETFKGSIFSSLAREICQNSLDARDDKTKPVKVVFEFMEVDTQIIPGIKILSRAIQYCKDFFSKNSKDERTKKFFLNAEAIVSRNKIRILRIGDYNTTGIYGAQVAGYASCPWNDLVKSSGISNKNGISGGSFGIGKYAPFVCSNIRTIFYSTLDKNNINAYQGVANLVSFQYPNDNADFNIKKGDISQGKGYYGKMKDNSAILEKFSLADYKRTETGTDLFVLGFIEEEGWQEKIIRYVIEEYLISILNKNLEVYVDGIIIDDKTIHNIIKKYKEEDLISNYYEVLTRNDVKIEKFNFNNMGEVELRIVIEKGFKRKVLMARNTGMKIFDQNRISGSIPFAGVCILKGEEVNKYFREMENPQHNKWEPDRHRNSKEAQKNKTELYSQIKEYILKLGKETTLAEMDAIGAGEFIPDLIKNNSNQEYSKESIGVEIKEFTPISKKKIKKDTIGENFEKLLKSDDTMLIDEQGVNEKDGKFDSGELEYSDGKASGGIYGGNEGGKGELDSDGKTKIQKPIPINVLKTRIIFDTVNSQYKLIFEPSQSAKNVEIEFVALGEQGNSKIKIKEAIINKETNLTVDNRGYINLDILNAGEKYMIQYKTENNEMCCMGVKLNGYKI